MDPQELTHATISNGWFREVSDESFPGQALELRVKKILYTGKSAFQDILVFESTDYGNVLVLDGIIQVSERDEFAYQEMITHIPLLSHPDPKRVLVIGGGDGGVLREVLKHPGVEELILVEIDATVIELSKKYLPNMSKSFDDPRVKVELCDGFKYLQENSKRFDVIITDSSDPDGPAAVFYEKNYFQLLHECLSDRGIVIMQASENIWLKISLLQRLKELMKQVFPVVEYCYTMVPTYTSGQLGLMICSKDETLDLKTPTRTMPNEDELFKYYNADIHKSSFVLPTWAKKYLK
ncbi:K00797 spermidine synthase [Cyberlindnera jadinii]|uniref:K00797 spermidine synthase n=1 Tax=Cyberlindnera jadinii (strain ATCC 18201 / CBS 1600 / BCRC 20928 / JCM 3617 / NBRC 0987 / NRRL Y-1542) TaxID=983966 RepID=A0A0H5C6P1_CYBJN|nr:spermine synthase [Cyberlindnera jadinii NRRL Y-1542]ODV71941.1 spermine synthase [Cyberlindnera jadinii NRRL Y-1542]CEP23761.1 K00797 spermidine synthase [Cyberlindnera jadinii]